MKILKTGFKDLYIMDYHSFSDNRGEFVKTIHQDIFEQAGLEYKFTESFYSVSKREVLRGMHFQLPPYDHAKLVYVITGCILDVVVDLRLESATYGQYFTIELSGMNRKGIYIGKGFAHGFLALQNNSVVEYHTTTSQNKEYEGGIKYDSFGFEWPVSNPVLSDRDNNFVEFNSFYNSGF